MCDNWGLEIWSLGLLPTGSKTLAEVGRPFGCAGCIKFAVTSGQKGTLNPMLCVKRVPRSLHVKNPCNNSFEGSVGSLLQGKISVPIQYTSFSSGSPNFPDHHPRWPLLYQPTYCIYCELVLVLNMHEIFATGR